jgi:hypothetical protein
MISFIYLTRDLDDQRRSPLECLLRKEGVLFILGPDGDDVQALNLLIHMETVITIN